MPPVMFVALLDWCICCGLNPDAADDELVDVRLPRSKSNGSYVDEEDEVADVGGRVNSL